jgi:hypothetical protein
MAAQVQAAAGNARAVLNVFGVEPSVTMRAQLPA